MKEHKKYTLMIPGPVEVMDDILEVYNGQPVAHYGTEWASFYIQTAQNVSELFGSKGRTYLMPGSGSLGLDSLSGTFCSGKRCLVLHNGMFGERLFNIASMYGSDIDVLKFPLNKPVDADDVRRTLKKRRYDAVFMTHVETSTGILNPAQEVCLVVFEQGLMFFLDAVSSAGVEEIKMDGWGISAVATASQKGLECPPGLGIVTVSENLLKSLRNIQKTGWYSNLGVWNDYYERWQDWHPFPVTLPTNIIMALSRSLSIMKSEGLQNRYSLYRNVSSCMRNAIQMLGLKLFAPLNGYAHGVTSVSTGGYFHPQELIDYLKKEHNIMITGSFGEIRESVFRIGHMSRKQCMKKNLTNLINGIALFLKLKGISVPVDEAISAFYYV